ncbi:hypothetical protein DSL72_003539 [Monilinia vaccinii-corymbosi]|uniref:Uncharacterized protein n=1 Tax=Monilinia vaccinii-corymbosi TaxID=61207 RepID=A0A8A3P817_9HELO|nr:hypothetical protein DSL72_003539 [Monilinia vaccinii-corymbosi]
MSRNTQRESFKTPTKPKKLKKSTKLIIDYSSDSSYAGVDLISDSEDGDSDDEPNVFGGPGGSRIEKYEEAAMFESAEEDDEIQTIEEFLDVEENTPGGTNSYEEWSGFEGSPGAAFDGVYDEHMYAQDSDNHGTSLMKRVTFADDDSDSDLSDEGSVMWHPDLFETETSAQGPFLSADALPPGIARRLEDDTYNDDNGSNPGSELDWGNGDDDSSEESDSDDSDASGYESDIGDDDGGDTTDDEDWRENRPEADESMPRGNSPKPPPCLGFRIQRKKGQPDVITWYHNTDVPFVILDEHGKDLLINGSIEQYNPVLNNQSNIMMSALSDTHTGFGSFHTGAPEAFFESNHLTDENVVRPTSSSSYEGSEDQGEPLLWGDLLHLDESDEDEGEDGPVEDILSTPARPTTSDGLHPLLVHLDKGTNVGAFRLNRQNENLINSNTISKDALAFGTSTIKGVKNGHLDSLTSSLTPRRKPSKSFKTSSPAGEVANRKRKSASEGRQSHKRNRSNA